MPNACNNSARLPPSFAATPKYDIPIPPQSSELAAQFRQKIGNRRVFLAASLREKDGQDEAELILNAWQPHADTLLVLIPRHPERFQAAYELARQRGFNTQKRSDNAPVRPDTQVWIGDSMGEMYAYFRLPTSSSSAAACKHGLPKHH